MNKLQPAVFVPNPATRTSHATTQLLQQNRLWGLCLFVPFHTNTSVIYHIFFKTSLPPFEPNGYFIISCRNLISAPFMCVLFCFHHCRSGPSHTVSRALLMRYTRYNVLDTTHTPQSAANRLHTSKASGRCDVCRGVESRGVALVPRRGSRIGPAIDSIPYIFRSPASLG